jgi:integrase
VRAVRKCAKSGEIQVKPGRAFECTACRGTDDAPGLPAGCRYHGLRHYFSSPLIADGADVKTVQARRRHGSA